MDTTTHSDVRAGVHLRALVYVVAREGTFKNCLIIFFVQAATVLRPSLTPVTSFTMLPEIRSARALSRAEHLDYYY